MLEFLQIRSLKLAYRHLEGGGFPFENRLYNGIDFIGSYHNIKPVRNEYEMLN